MSDRKTWSIEEGAAVIYDSTAPYKWHMEIQRGSTFRVIIETQKAEGLMVIASMYLAGGLSSIDEIRNWEMELEK